LNSGSARLEIPLEGILNLAAAAVPAPPPPPAPAPASS